MKPFSNDFGYVDSRETPFGWAVIYDRHQGGDWIDGDERWVIAAFDANKANIALLDCPTKKMAMHLMRDASDGEAQWVLGGEGTPRAEGTA